MFIQTVHGQETRLVGGR